MHLMIAAAAFAALAIHANAAPSGQLRVCTVATDLPAIHAAGRQLRGWLERAVLREGAACMLEVVNINVTAHDKKAAEGCLSLGPGAAAALHPEFRFPDIVDGSPTEAFAMQLAADGTGYVLTGDPADTSSYAKGTYFAALEFVERVGIRFLTSDAMASTKTATLCALPDFKRAGLPEAFHFSPPLEYRKVLAWDTDQHAPFSESKRFNPLEYPYATPPGFVHTSYKLLNDTASTTGASVGKLWQTHNEWFWPRKDADPSGSVYGQLCWSNSSLVAFVTQRAIAMLKDQPDASVISVSQNDNFNYCNSTAERAMYEADGGARIGPILRAANVIADAIAREFPSRAVSVDTLAYQWTRAAPSSTIPRHNVIVRLCSIECNFGAPLTDESNARFQNDIVNWGTRSNRTWIWNYVTDFSNYVMPWPDYSVLAPNTQFYMKHGVSGIFQEGAYQSTGSDLASLKTYLMSRLLWDPLGTDVNATVSEFLELYYGEAVAPRMQAYMNLWTKAVQDTEYYMGESVPFNAAYLTPANLLRSAALTEPANGDDASKAKRLRTAKMSTLYVIMLRWSEVRSFANVNRIAWPYKEETLKDAFATFSAIFNESGATLLSEGGHDLAWLKKAANVPLDPRGV